MHTISSSSSGGSISTNGTRGVRFSEQLEDYTKHSSRLNKVPSSSSSRSILRTANSRSTDSGSSVSVGGGVGHRQAGRSDSRSSDRRGGGHDGKTNSSINDPSIIHSLVAAKNNQYRGGAPPTTGSSRRDPTPKSTQQRQPQQQNHRMKEPPAAVPNGRATAIHGTPPRQHHHHQSHNNHLTTSDPPIDRSRKPLYSPAAGLTRPTDHGSYSEPRRPVERGAFLLSPSTTSVPRSMRSLQQNQGSRLVAEDVELNPRRLAQEFPTKQSSSNGSHSYLRSSSSNNRGGVRQNQAPPPTPNNRLQMDDQSQKLMAARDGTLRQNQSPTPNNSRTKAAATTAASSRTTLSSIVGGNLWGNDWSELLPRNNASARDKESSWDMSHLFSPTEARSSDERDITGRKQNQQQQQQQQSRPNNSQVPKTKYDDEEASVSSNERSTSETSDVGITRLSRLDSDSDSDTSSTESQSAYLINKYSRPAANNKSSRTRPNKTSRSEQKENRNKTTNKNAEEIYRAPPPPSPANTLDGLLGPVRSEKANTKPQAPKRSQRQEQIKRLGLSDSQVLKDKPVGIVGVSKKTPSSYSHLEDGSNGVVPPANQGAEVTLVSSLPRHIQVQLDGWNTTTTKSVDEESTTGSDVVLMAPSKRDGSYHHTKTKRQGSLRVGNPLGGVLRMFSQSDGPRAKKTSAYQDLYGDDKSQDSFAGGELYIYNNDKDEDHIIKQSTSDTTDDSNDESNNIRNQSSWYPTHDNQKSDNDESRSVKRARKNKSWMIWVLFCTIFVCLAVGLPSYFVLTNEQSDSEASISPTPPPLKMEDCVNHDAASDGSFSERYSLIRNYLLLKSVGNTPMIDVPNSPQRNALCWLSEFDDFKVTVSMTNEYTIIQRYTLGVIFFSTQTAVTIATSSSLAGTDFLSPKHECDWDVIICTEEDHVSALLLSDKQLAGSLPVEVGNLVHLSFLELSLNSMTGTIPTSIQRLTSLEYLAMAFNELTGTLPSILGRISTLQFLNFRSSGIHGTIPTELGSIASLETLLLEGNWLSGVIPRELGNLYQANQMGFRKNYLSGRVAVELCELRSIGKLQELTVDYWVECECCTG